MINNKRSIVRLLSIVLQMESLIIISIKLKYYHQTHTFKWHIDEGWNGRGAAAATSRGEGKNAQKVMGASSRDITKRGFVFDAPPPALPVPTNTNGKNNKRMKEVSTLVPRCWHLPSLGGSEDSPLASPPPPPSTVAPSLYLETRGKRIRRRTPYPLRLIIFPLARWRQQHLWLLPQLEW